jgi:hypothetical protein
LFLDENILFSTLFSNILSRSLPKERPNFATIQNNDKNTDIVILLCFEANEKATDSDMNGK